MIDLNILKLMLKKNLKLLNLDNNSGMNQLKSFLVSRMVPKKGMPFTHTSLAPRKMTYLIDDENLPELYELYHKAIFIDKEYISLTEAPRTLTPIKIDLDFKYLVKNGSDEDFKRRYDMDKIIEFIKLYMKNILEWYQLEDKEKLCFVMEKKNPTLTDKVENGKRIVKDGVHLMFPYLMTTADAQFLIREKVLLEMDSITEDMNLINSNADVLDIAVIARNNWMMYGSAKKKNSEPYLLTHVFKGDINTELIEEMDKSEYTDEQLVRLLSIRAGVCRGEGESKIKITKLSELTEACKVYVSKKKNKKTGNCFKSNIKLTLEDLNLIKDLVNCLSVERATNRDSWIRVGWCLHNLGNNPELLQYWTEFSSKVEMYKESAAEDCEREWENMDYKSDGLTKMSLDYWAEQDNKLEYSKVKLKQSKKVLEESLTPSIQSEGSNSTITEAIEKGHMVHPDMIAKLLHSSFSLRFILVGKTGKGVYYTYNNHRWKEMDGNILLREKIRTHIFDAYTNYVRDVLSNPTDNQNIIDKWTKDTKLITKVLTQLRQTTFKNNVMEECKEHFYDKSEVFLKKLDENPNLLGFENGVYDFSENKFRPGNPDDHLSMSTRIEYRKYDWRDEEVEQVMDFIDQVLPDEEVKEYVLTLLATFLHGSNKSEKFHIWTGTGGNGKSKLIELFEAAIGDYSCKLPISLLTSKRKASGDAQPELHRTKGKRSAILQEPDEKTRINVGLMKEMTGGDTIIARTLYEKPVEFKPQIKMILVCNHLPELPYDDEATWRRVRAVEFKSKFVDEDDWDPNDRYQFVKDCSLSDNFSNWKEPFIWVLIEYYKKWLTTGLVEPKQVTECTDKYKTQNDGFREFFNNCVDKSGNEEDKILIGQLYTLYKRVAHSNEEKPKQKKELLGYMEKRLGKSDGSGNQKGWVGYRIQGSDYIDDEFEDD